MNFYGASHATKYRAFSTTFRGVARSWYDSIPAQSITSFKCFKKLFIGNFMANKRRPKKITNLWSITQGPNETFERYTKRFIAAYLCVTNPNEKFSIQAYVIGVANESVQLALCSNDVESMETWLIRRTSCLTCKKWAEIRHLAYNKMIKEEWIMIAWGGHHKETERVIDQNHQGNSCIESLRATHHW